MIYRLRYLMAIAAVAEIMIVVIPNFKRSLWLVGPENNFLCPPNCVGIVLPVDGEAW